MTPGDQNFGMNRRQFMSVAGIAGAGVLLSSCTSKSKGNSPQQSSSEAGKPKRGGTFRLGVDGGASTDDMNPENAHTIASVNRVSQINETLMMFDPDFKLQYYLAESLEANSDATKWTLRLKPGIEFHNGKPLTAEDVLFSFQYTLDPKAPGAVAGSLNTLDVANLKAVDKLTLEIPFKTPLSYLPEILGLNNSTVVRIVPVGFDVTKPVGTGPYVFKEFTPGRQSTFTRNPNYWQNGKPYFDEIVTLDIGDDSARLNALTSNQVDAIVDVALAATAQVKSSSDLVLMNSETGGFNPLTMRVDTAPFDNPDVRLAMKLIADRPALVDSSLAGYGAIANDLYGRYDVDYNSDIPQREQDLDQARSLLRRAGHENLTVSLTTANFAAGMVAMATAFAEQASQAGVKVNIDNVPADQFFPKYALKVPFSVDNWSTRPYLLQATASMTPSSSFNETHWSNEKWLGYVTEASQTPDESLRKELIHEAQKVEHDEGGYLIWGWFNTTDAYNKKVSGFRPDKSGVHFSTQFANAWFNS